jgi:hypothetical protein
MEAVLLGNPESLSLGAHKYLFGNQGKQVDLRDKGKSREQVTYSER